MKRYRSHEWQELKTRFEAELWTLREEMKKREEAWEERLKAAEVRAHAVRICGR